MFFTFPFTVYIIYIDKTIFDKKKVSYLLLKFY